MGIEDSHNVDRTPIYSMLPLHPFVIDNRLLDWEPKANAMSRVSG